MAGRSLTIRLTRWTHWVSAIILLLWSHQISGQGQGPLLEPLPVTVMSSKIFPLSQVVLGSHSHLVKQCALSMCFQADSFACAVHHMNVQISCLAEFDMSVRSRVPEEKLRLFSL
ncbi:uncharacterized protein LOC418465 [Gallus gallus]|uniref:uncharacterized protein LOC418465 n=1 Tax=Gallus gallus TaxID=9031 RepID=UPI00003A9C41|nr:uncharacterized protein LOC418465 [Gallus gallus]